jgi:hypothetical protein
VSGAVQQAELHGARCFVFERLLSEVGLGWRQCVREVADRFALASVEVGFDLGGQDGAAPAMLKRFRGYPSRGLIELDFLSFFVNIYVNIHAARSVCLE